MNEIFGSTILPMLSFGEWNDDGDGEMNVDGIVTFGPLIFQAIHLMKRMDLMNLMSCTDDDEYVIEIFCLMILLVVSLIWSEKDVD